MTVSLEQNRPGPLDGSPEHRQHPGPAEASLVTQELNLAWTRVTGD